MFNPAHYTRDKDGAPSPVAPPLSADADKGDQEALLLSPGGDQYKCAACAHVQIMQAHQPACPRCGGEFENVMIRPSMGPHKGKVYDFGLQAYVDKLVNHPADQAICFQSRIARNGRGQPKDIVDCLTGAESGTRADAKPLVALPQSSRVNTGDTCETLSSQTSAGRGGTDAPKVLDATVRRLTPVECERLQGLPDGWTEGFSDSVRYRMIGNSVAVPVFRWVAQRLKQHLPK